MTTFAASVTIVDLPVGTTVSGAELFEAVQTTNGVGQSVQLSLSQIAAFTTSNNFIKTVGTGLATSGTITSIVAFVANNGISSSQLASSSVGSTSIAASGVVRSNITALAIGSAQLDVSAVQQSNITAAAIGSTQLGALAVQQSNITAAAIGSTQLGALAVQQSNITAAAIGSTQIANFAVTAGQIQTATIGTAQVVTGAIGLTLLNTLTASSVASINDTTSLSAGFRNYRIMFDNVCPATQTTTLQIQVATTGTAFISGGYVCQCLITDGSTTVVNTSTTALIMCGIGATTQMQTSLSYGATGLLDIYHPAGTTNRVQILGWMTYVTPGAVGTATIAQARFNGFYDGSNNPITGINFLFNSGNIQTGTFKIYGYY